MEDPSFILGTHKNNPDWPLTLVMQICVLCDKEMLTSGYGIETKTLKTYAMNSEKNKYLAIECVMRLMGQAVHAMQSVEGLVEGI